MQDKVDPYLRPLYDALGDMLGGEAFHKNIERGLIEVAPLAYMRGRTLDDAFIILDEAQNTTPEQMKMFLTRMGFSSKIVVTGDVTQIDLPRDKKSGLRDAEIVLKNVEGIEFMYLSEADVVRHPLVQKIVKAYERKTLERERVQKISAKAEMAMKVAIRNNQKKFKVTKEIRDLVRAAVKAALDYMDFEFGTKAEISLMFTDNEEIRELNREHRNIDRATDVLSFPLLEYDEEGNILDEYMDFNPDGEMFLGDIVISLERAAEQADEYGHSFEREVGFLTVHSMLHLFGYDHMTPEDEEEMFGYQEDILKEMGLLR
jgi:rRNA maturation RNase YbeY